MRNNTFMDNVAVGLVLAVFLVNILHGIFTGTPGFPLAGDPVVAEVRHV